MFDFQSKDRKSKFKPKVTIVFLLANKLLDPIIHLQLKTEQSLRCLRCLLCSSFLLFTIAELWLIFDGPTRLTVRPSYHALAVCNKHHRQG